jgi:putative tryptophan/tyrosine transport system substrate-binding protein
MRRREFIGGVLITFVVPCAYAEETAKVHRIVVISPSAPVAVMREFGGMASFEALFSELHRLGYVEGKSLVVERYSGEGRIDQYVEISREAVRRRPDLIFAVGTPMALRLQSATSTIPVVVTTADPVANGLARSLARPGGNITGVAVDAGKELWSKRLALLKEAVPTLSRVGFLAVSETWEGPSGAALREAAQGLGVSLVGWVLRSGEEAEYRRVFGATIPAQVDGLVVSDAAEHFINRQLIPELVEKARLPTIYAFRESVEAGGLMAYTFDIPDTFRLAAKQIDQILRGAKPADIPFISQPSSH